MRWTVTVINIERSWKKSLLLREEMLAFGNITVKDQNLRCWKEMMQFISSQESCQELQFPIRLKVMIDEETKHYHRQKLYELSLKTIWEIPQLDEPTDEQKKWFIGKMKAPAWTWESRFE